VETKIIALDTVFSPQPSRLTVTITLLIHFKTCSETPYNSSIRRIGVTYHVSVNPF